MAFRAVAVYALLLAPCPLPGASSNGADAAVDAAATAPTVQGSACATDAETGATLCAAVSTCPSVVVDRDAFPDCGFRVHGAALDLVCACAGALCPIGGAASCAEAASLLGGAQSEAVVCAARADGRCVETKAPGGAGGGAGGGTSTCDRACAADCAGDPTCLVACGC